MEHDFSEKSQEAPSLAVMVKEEEEKGESAEVDEVGEPELEKQAEAHGFLQFGTEKSYPEEGEAMEEGEEELSELSGSEEERYLMSEDQVRIKTLIWNSNNKEWLAQ